MNRWDNYTDTLGELYHSGRKGMKWGKNIFKKDYTPTESDEEQRKHAEELNKKTYQARTDRMNKGMSRLAEGKAYDAVYAQVDAEDRNHEYNVDKATKLVKQWCDERGQQYAKDFINAGGSDATGYTPVGYFYYRLKNDLRKQGFTDRQISDAIFYDGSIERSIRNAAKKNKLIWFN